jgi:predicted RNA binding protein YcfA (HicA-like mRNA interferase family)
MKRKALIRRIEELGAVFSEEGKKHTHYCNKRGRLIAVPRHAEVNEHTAKKLIRDASES